MPLESKPTRVYVYRDVGVGPFSYRELLGSLIDLIGTRYTVDPITSTQLSTGEWKRDAALLAFPGGRDIPYMQALGGAANSHIRDFVAQGGSFLGICAGAYYGCNEVIFAKGGPLEIVGPRELKFFPGEAVGPVYDPSVFSYDSEVGARAVHIGLDDVSLKAYYNGGCAFQSPERFENCSVIGRYLDYESAAAIVSCHVGKGLAILSGVHFEYRSKFLSKLGIADEMRVALAACEETRRTVFNQLIGYLVARRACVG